MKKTDSVFTGRNGTVAFAKFRSQITLAFTLPGPLHSQQIRLVFHEDFLPSWIHSRICTLGAKIGLSDGDLGHLLLECQAVSLAELYEDPIFLAGDESASEDLNFTILVNEDEQG